VNNHISWGKDILTNGPSGVYQRDFASYGTMTPSYPPLSVLAFTFSQLLFNTSNSLIIHLNNSISLFPSNLVWFFEDQDTQAAFHKIWAILADIGIAVLVARRLSIKLAFWGVIINPAFWYNSAVWGQIESVPVFFVVLALFLHEKHLNLSVSSLVTALLFKQSSIIFVPLFLVYSLKHHSISKVFVSWLIGLVVFFVSFLPFYSSGNFFLFPFHTYLNKLQTGSGSNFITDHAFNVYFLNTDLYKTSDKATLVNGLSYGQAGTAIFAFIFAVLFFIQLKNTSLKVHFQLLGLCIMSAFLFLTRMHERYLFPAVVFFIFSKKTKTVIILSLVYLANMYHNWWAPRIDLAKLLLENQVVIFTLILFLYTVYFVNFGKVIIKKA
jgi:Gpi18-like mannosyltransferase